MTNARLFADMGFDAWVFARHDLADMPRRRNEKLLEFIWRPTYQDLGNKTQIFTHIMFNHYSSPDGLKIDDPFGHDLPVYADVYSLLYNAGHKLKYLHEHVYR